MNYAELCRQIAGEMLATVEVLNAGKDGDAERQLAALLDAAAGLYEGCSSVHFRDAQDAVALADAVAKGAE